MTITRSPGANPRTASPTSVTMPTASWPRIVPLSIPAMVPRTRCRSVPQIALRVILTIASCGSMISGWGTSSRRMSPMPCQTIAFMVVPFSVDLGRVQILRARASMTAGSLRRREWLEHETEEIRRRQCGRRDLNPHAFRHRYLKPACIPISPLPRALTSVMERRRTARRQQPPTRPTGRVAGCRQDHPVGRTRGRIRPVDRPGGDPCGKLARPP